MPVFSKTLKNLDGLPPEEAVKAVAGHLRSMQEELEYRLTCLDSSNITEIDTTQTNILTSNGEFAGIVGQMSSLGIELDVIRSIVNGQSETFGKRLSQVEQTASAISSQVSANEAAISTIEQTAGSITKTVTDLENKMSTTVRQTADGLVIETTAVGEDGETVVQDEKIIISGGQLKAGTVTADLLRGSAIGLKYDDHHNAGIITLGQAASGSFAVDVRSYSAMRVGANDGNLFLFSGFKEATNGVKTYYGPCLTLQYIKATETAPEDLSVVCKGTLIPNASGAWYCGNASYPWQGVFTTTGTVSKSDRNSKNSIEPLPDKYVDMFDGVVPVRFKMNDGTSGRYHVGFISQEVEEAMTAAGIDSLEFGGWCKDKAEDGSDIYMLRYDEFIGILAAKIKQLESRINEMEAKA